MSTERDELAALIARTRHVRALHLELPASIINHVTGGIAEAVLEAGYRKPRTVTTVEELDALPIGHVVILRDAKQEPHPAQKGEHGWRLPFVDGFWTAEKLLAGSETAEVIS